MKADDGDPWKEQLKTCVKMCEKYNIVPPNLNDLLFKLETFGLSLYFLMGLPPLWFSYFFSVTDITFD